jgi:hypothetical protein
MTPLPSGCGWLLGPSAENRRKTRKEIELDTFPMAKIAPISVLDTTSSKANFITQVGRIVKQVLPFRPHPSLGVRTPNKFASLQKLVDN